MYLIRSNCSGSDLVVARIVQDVLSSYMFSMTGHARRYFIFSCFSFTFQGKRQWACWPAALYAVITRSLDKIWWVPYLSGLISFLSTSMLWYSLSVATSFPSIVVHLSRFASSGLDGCSIVFEYSGCLVHHPMTLVI